MEFYKTMIIAQCERFNLIHTLPQKGIGEESLEEIEVTVINKLSSTFTLNCVTTKTELSTAVYLFNRSSAERQYHFVHQKASFCQVSNLSFSQFKSSNP